VRVTLACLVKEEIRMIGTTIEKQMKEKTRREAWESASILLLDSPHTPSLLENGASAAQQDAVLSVRIGSLEPVHVPHRDRNPILRRRAVSRL
jgi:hypothetical protein